jgi:phosphoglycolate phosphatase
VTSAFAVGFDLDMTLVDSRAGIAATYRELTRRTGVWVDADVAVTRLGPPLRDELARWFPPEAVDDAVRSYRALYPTHAITLSGALPGALEALESVRARGGRVIVVTSKLGRLAHLHLDHLRLVADEVVGELFAEGKAAALAAYGARAYVGDHVADMRAARTAGVPGVGVTTGPCPRSSLEAAGAAEVIDDLRGFPAALDRLRRIAW